MAMAQQQLLEADGWKLEPQALRALAEDLQGGSELPAMLLDTDLRDVGCRCLPPRQRRSGLLVLQVSSIEDIGESRGSNHGKRMLRVHLTDGHSTAAGIEYKPIPSLSVDIPPGTKVRLKDARVQNGLLLLEPSCIEVLGGRVPILYDGWEIQRKYSGAARKLLRSAKEVHGAPMFRGLGPGAKRRDEQNQVSTSSGTAAATATGKTSSTQPSSSSTSTVVRSDSRADALRAAVELNPEVGPSHNHAAAQKLLSRSVEAAAAEGGRRRGRMRRGSGRNGDDEQRVMTLDEWEAARKGAIASAGGATASVISSISRHDALSDEELARRLQQQLDMEANEAEGIRLSMFNFGERDNDMSSGGRGRGRGRSRGRGRGGGGGRRR